MAGTWNGVLLVGLILVVICGPGDSTKKSYTGYHVVRVTLDGDADWLKVKSILKDESLELELWSAPSSPNDIVDIQVAAPALQRLLTELEKHNVHYSIFIEDIQNMIEFEAQSEQYELLKDKKLSHRERRSTTARVSNKVVGKYAELEEVETWMQMLATHCPELVTLETVGQTHEKRKIYALKLGKEVKGRVKPAIYMDGAMHAREWISPATVVYMIYQLLSRYMLGDEEVIEYVDLLDWYFVPIANPDGFHFSHTKERLWRKNRSPITNSSCIGTDLNRNWPYHWGHEPDANGVTPFTSDNPCSIVYLGSGPGSELETQALMKFLLRHNDSIKVFVSHHSYTQKWFTRWGYTNSTPPDYNESLAMAEKAVAALEKTGGEPYNVGRPFELLYAYTGGSADWAKGVAGIKYSYTVELRDRGRFGFLLPANYVVPVGEELWSAMKVVASQLINETYRIDDEGNPITASVDKSTSTTTKYTQIGNTTDSGIGENTTKPPSERPNVTLVSKAVGLLNISIWVYTWTLCVIFKTWTLCGVR